MHIAPSSGTVFIAAMNHSITSTFFTSSIMSDLHINNTAFSINQYKYHYKVICYHL